MNLLQVAQLGEDLLVAERDENYTVVGQSRERSVDGHLLTSTRSTGRYEDAGVLAMEKSLSPETTSSVPEGLRGIRGSVSIILSNRRGDEPEITFH